MKENARFMSMPVEDVFSKDKNWDKNKNTETIFFTETLVKHKEEYKVKTNISCKILIINFQFSKGKTVNCRIKVYIFENKITKSCFFIKLKEKS